MKNHHVRIFGCAYEECLHVRHVSLRGTSIRPITAGVVGGGFGGASASSPAHHVTWCHVTCGGRRQVFGFARPGPIASED